MKQTIRSRLRSARAFFDDGIYSREDPRGPVRSRAFRALRAIVFSVQGFFRKSLSDRASAMTYNTLMAAVPVAALMIVVGRGFGIQENLNDFIVSVFPENLEAAATVIGFANRYLEYMQRGTFVGVGIFVLLAAVIGLLRQVETQFNRVWNVRRSRPIVRQVATYFTIIVLIPMLIVVAGGIKPLLHPWIVRILSAVMVIVVLALVYALMPNTRVRFGAALIGAVVAGTVLILLETLYVTGQVSLTKYNAVYGGFAALPLFLFWVHLSWLVIMYGAELSYATQNSESYISEHRAKAFSRSTMDCLTLVVVRIAIDSFSSGRGAISLDSLARDHGIPLTVGADLVALLEQTGIFVEVVSPDLVRRWMPAIEPDRLTMGRVLSLINGHGLDSSAILSHAGSEQWLDTIRTRYTQVWDAALREADQIRLADL